MVINGKDGLLTTARVANILHMHSNTVRRLSDRGIINSIRIGPRNDRRFDPNHVADFLASSAYHRTKGEKYAKAMLNKVGGQYD